MNINFLSQKQKERVPYILLWLLLVVGLYLIKPVLLPFILACFLAYILNPLVRLLIKLPLKKNGLPRSLAVLIIYFLCALIVFLFAAFFTPGLYSEIGKLAKDTTTFSYLANESRINELSSEVDLFIKKYELPFEVINHENKKNNEELYRYENNIVYLDVVNIVHSLVKNTLNAVNERMNDIVSSAQIFFSKIISSAFTLFLVLMITAFILVDLPRIKKFAFNLVPLSDQNAFEKFLSKVDSRLSGVVRGQIIICSVNAILTLLGLLILKVNFAFILALVAGVFSIIPIFGSILSTIPIFLVALTTSTWAAVLSLLWIGLIHAIEANILNPKIMGDSAKIHPVLIVLSLMAGKYFYGIVGALLAVPVMSILVTVYLSVLYKLKENWR